MVEGWYSPGASETELIKAVPCLFTILKVKRSFPLLYKDQHGTLALLSSLSFVSYYMPVVQMCYRSHACDHWGKTHEGLVVQRITEFVPLFDAAVIKTGCCALVCDMSTFQRRHHHQHQRHHYHHHHDHLVPTWWLFETLLLHRCQSFIFFHQLRHILS